MSNIVIDNTNNVTATINGGLSITDNLCSSSLVMSNSPLFTDNHICSIGDNQGTTNIYICEEWESKKPIKIRDGLYVSLKEDLYSMGELESEIKTLISDNYPETAIKLGINENIVIKKHSYPIDIFLKKD